MIYKNVSQILLMLTKKSLDTLKAIKKNQDTLIAYDSRF